MNNNDLLQQLNQLRPNPGNFNTDQLWQKILELKQSETLAEIHHIKEDFQKEILKSKRSTRRWQWLALALSIFQIITIAIGCYCWPSYKSQPTEENRSPVTNPLNALDQTSPIGDYNNSGKDTLPEISQMGIDRSRRLSRQLTIAQLTRLLDMNENESMKKLSYSPSESQSQKSQNPISVKSPLNCIAGSYTSWQLGEE